jgi:hypothetical protein
MPPARFEEANPAIEIPLATALDHALTVIMVIVSGATAQGRPGPPHVRGF